MRLKWFTNFGTFGDLVMSVSIFSLGAIYKGTFLGIDGIQYSVTIIHISRNGG